MTYVISRSFIRYSTSWRNAHVCALSPPKCKLVVLHKADTGVVRMVGEWISTNITIYGPYMAIYMAIYGPYTFQDPRAPCSGVSLGHPFFGWALWDAHTLALTHKHARPHPSCASPSAEKNSVSGPPSQCLQGALAPRRGVLDLTAGRARRVRVTRICIPTGCTRRSAQDHGDGFMHATTYAYGLAGVHGYAYG